MRLCFRLECFTYYPIEYLEQKASSYGRVRDANIHRASEILQLTDEAVKAEPWKTVIEKVWNEMNKTSGTMMDDQDFISGIRGFDRNVIANLNDSTQLSRWKQLYDSSPDYVFLNAKRKWYGGPFFGFPNSRCWIFSLCF